MPVEGRQDSIAVLFEALDAPQKPFNEAMKQIEDNLELQAGEVYADSAFTFADNAVQLRRFLDRGDKRSTIPPSIEVRNGVKQHMSDAKLANTTVQRLYEELSPHYAGETPDPSNKEGIYFDEGGRVQKVLINSTKPGVYIALRSANPERTDDLTELHLQPGIEFAADEILREESLHKVSAIEAPPFIDTAAAHELAATFEKAGLQMSFKLRNGFVEDPAIEKRYGQGYAYLTLEIGKCVNESQKHHITDYLFAGGELDERNTEAEFNKTMQILQNLEDATDPAAQVVVKMLRGIAQRGSEEALTNLAGLPSVPSSNEIVEIRNGSCKDSEFYIASGRPVSTEHGEPPVLWKSGSPRSMFMSLRPVQFRGVELPGGSLFKQAPDGSFVFARITSYAFNKEKAAEVFGIQEYENQQASGDKMERVRQQVTQERV